MAKEKNATPETQTPSVTPEDRMAAIEAKIAEMMANAEKKLEQAEEAQKKAEEILAAAEAKTAPIPAEAKIAEINAAGEEYVIVELFKDNDKYSDDVFVAVNGEGCNIPRGRRVKIKRKFWDVLNQSRAQDVKTAQLIQDKADEYANDAQDRLK